MATPRTPPRVAFPTDTTYAFAGEATDRFRQRRTTQPPAQLATNMRLVGSGIAV